MWKKDTSICLDFFKFLLTVPCFTHTSTPWILRSTIYLDKAKLKANIGPKTPSYKNYSSSHQKLANSKS